MYRACSIQTLLLVPTAFVSGVWIQARDKTKFRALCGFSWVEGKHDISGRRGQSIVVE